MSCCGIDPIASVQECGDEGEPFLGAALGQKLETFPSRRLAAMIFCGPPAMSPTTQAMTPRPTMIMTELEEIGHGHGPHPAPDGVGEDDTAADDDSGLEGDGAARQRSRKQGRGPSVAPRSSRDRR